MESMMTNLGSSVMVHGFSCLGGGFFGCDLSLDYGLCCESGRLWVMELRYCGLVVVCLAV